MKYFITIVAIAKCSRNSTEIVSKLFLRILLGDTTLFLVITHDLLTYCVLMRIVLPFWRNKDIYISMVGIHFDVLTLIGHQ